MCASDTSDLLRLADEVRRMVRERLEELGIPQTAWGGLADHCARPLIQAAGIEAALDGIDPGRD